MRSRPALLRLVVAAALVAGGQAALAAGGQPWRPTPVGPGWLPDNPFMSANGIATMHADSYASDTHPGSGPLGRSPQVRFAAKGPCAGLTFTKERLVVLQCGGARGFSLRLVDPVTLQDLATYDLPQRPSTFQAAETADLSKAYKDSSGAYFYLDDQDRAVVADAAQHVQRVVHEQAADGSWRFRQVDDWDLTPYLPHDCASATNPLPAGECDPVTGVLPDWQGRLWWVTRYGRVGTIDPATGAVRVLRLAGEEVENSHAASEDGVAVVSDHALYLMRAAADGTPTIVWREAYDRGTARKSGQINQGSGATPTFLGHDYVAITDNADDRMHVLVYKRADQVTGARLVCAVPVFGHDAGSTENTLVGWGDGLAVENNFGYENPVDSAGRPVVGGVARVDVLSDHACALRWTSSEPSASTVPKLSRGNGLLYLYTKHPGALGVDAWDLTAVDWRTGRTVYSVRTGYGPAYDNAWAPITIGPNGTAYVSCFGGLLSVRDST